MTDTLPAADAGPVDQRVVQLVEKMRGAASAGYDEWRVQDPKDGSYCIAYSWPETMSPEREARAWLADHKARFPNSQHAHFVVACVRVVPEKDRLLLEAAEALDEMQRDLDENEALRERLAELLTGVAVALRGPQPPLTRWGWHDLPERAAAVQARIDAAVVAERDWLLDVIERWRVPVGNSCSGELAAEWTMEALRDLRDAIRARATAPAEKD